jgi:hypothetical protein
MKLPVKTIIETTENIRIIENEKMIIGITLKNIVLKLDMQSLNP